MKKHLFALLLLATAFSSAAQTPSYTEKLYYTCKVWGFTKYYHSKVSNCMVNWDSVLLATLPVVKNAATSSQFNDALLDMLNAAGPMDIATSYFPDTLSPELKRNRNWGWVHDAALRSDVQIILDTIKNNFRPHAGCWIMDNDYMNPNYYGYLVFPHDSLMSNTNFATSYPDEWNRLLAVFKHWNIVNYFNPYNYALEVPWDTTLMHHIVTIADAPDYPTFVNTFKKMTGAMNDAHVEGLTWTNYSQFPAFYTVRLVLRYMQGKYIVVKSGINNVNNGDEIVSVDGLTTAQWEDSLRPYVSAGNPSVFRRFACQYLIAGAYNSTAIIVYKDAAGTNHTISQTRANSPYDAFYNYYPNDTLAATTWTVLGCGVGYANIGNMSEADADAMYDALQSSAALIIDIRNYPSSASVWELADRMYPNEINFAKLTLPDVTYPGTYMWDYPTLGSNNNPVTYQGKIIVLFNQETQSAAEYDCMILDAMPDVVKIGSQTAGADGNVCWFKLSQELHTGFTSLGVFYPNGDSTQRRGIVPDIIVTPTQAGIRDGRDEVLEKAIEIACAEAAVPKVKTTKGIKVYPNPATDVVFVSAANSSEMDISISDISGRQILVGSFNNGLSNIDIKALAPGMYIMNIKAGTEQKTMKLVKQ